MHLQRLRAEGFRNLEDINFKPHPSCNIIVGANGSGKTSLLEAIHVLSLGRSFRTRELQPVINHQKTRLVCYAEVAEKDKLFPLGVEKRAAEALILQARGETGVKLTDFIANMPVQIITPDSFDLLTTGPEIRRRFIDLGVFHVEHSFVGLSMRFKKGLKQRNAALKQQASPQVIRALDEGFVFSAEAISTMRQHYLSEYIPIFYDILAIFLPNLCIQYEYVSGWAQNSEGGYAEALKKTLEQDYRYRSTSVGPHRADLKFSVAGFPAQHILSRGQQKLFVSALILAQSVYLSQQTAAKSIFLIDDLASELDKYNLSLILNWLLEREHQVFITSVEEDIWSDLCDGAAHEMFHVKHGRVAIRSLVK